jgi:hypothetical protein
MIQLTEWSAVEFWVPSCNKYQIIVSLPAILLSRQEALQFQWLLHLISAKSYNDRVSQVGAQQGNKKEETKNKRYFLLRNKSEHATKIRLEELGFVYDGVLGIRFGNYVREHRLT